MQFTHLEAFLSIIDTQSISKAADRIHMSQANVSILLHSLEAEIGQPLVLRERGRNKRILPTNAGVRFYTFAKNTMDSYDQVLSQLYTQASSEVSPIRIVTGQTLSVTLLARMLRIAEHQGLNLNVNIEVCKMSCSDDIKSALESVDCDFAIATYPIEDARYISQFFLLDPIVLISNRCLNLEKKIPFSLIPNLPLVLREPTCDTMITLAKSLEKHGLSMDALNPRLRVYGASAVREAVKNGALCEFVPFTTCSPEDFGHIKMVNVSGFESRRSIYLISSADKVLSPEMRIFRRFVLSGCWHDEIFRLDQK